MTWTKCFTLAVLICPWLPFSGPAQGLPAMADKGGLTYPASGNIQLDEGTLDVWVISNFDTDATPAKPAADQRAATLFSLTFPDENWKYVIYFIPWANAFALVGYAQPGQGYIWLGPPHWKPGEAHHVVCTWSGRKRGLFIDGNCEWKGAKGAASSGNVEVCGPLHGDLTRALLEFGNSFITFDEIQIRNVALTPDEVVKAKDAPLMADEHTLLLDHCDGGPAEIIGGPAGPAGRVVVGKYQLVDGKFGKAMQMWVEKK
jgi:hypothetical protein